MKPQFKKIKFGIQACLFLIEYIVNIWKSVSPYLGTTYEKVLAFSINNTDFYYGVKYELEIPITDYSECSAISQGSLSRILFLVNGFGSFIIGILYISSIIANLYYRYKLDFKSIFGQNVESDEDMNMSQNKIKLEASKFLFVPGVFFFSVIDFSKPCIKLNISDDYFWVLLIAVIIIVCSIASLFYNVILFLFFIFIYFLCCAVLYVLTYFGTTFGFITNVLFSTDIGIDVFDLIVEWLDCLN